MHTARASVAAADGTFIPEDLLERFLDCFSEDSNLADLCHY